MGRQYGIIRSHGEAASPASARQPMSSMANSSAFPFSELSRFPGNEQQRGGDQTVDDDDDDLTSSIHPFKMGAKLSAAQFPCELLALRGRYSHSSQVFAAALGRTFASTRTVPCSLAPPLQWKEGRKRGKWGNEGDFFSPKLGCGRDWRRYCCCYRIFLPI